ncbi:MAG TPA: hypothetical protein VKE98_17765 [Gemmataceae bacterium]|nr:hypothetical protein [Gemmataceae bacterium]
MAVLLGIFLFVLFNIVSMGLLVTLITVGILFGVFGLGHYLWWGRPLKSRMSTQSPPVQPAEPADTFVVELTDEERAEPIQLLEQSSAAGMSRSAALRRDLLSKLRMFGA